MAVARPKSDLSVVGRSMKRMAVVAVACTECDGGSMAREAAAGPQVAVA